jgi:hypothetical protein
MDVNVRNKLPNPLPSLPWEHQLPAWFWSMAKFASMHGFAPHRIYFWSRKLAAKPAGATAGAGAVWGCEGPEMAWGLCVGEPPEAGVS